MPWTEIIVISVVLAIMGAVWVILDLLLYASQEAEVKTNQTHAENTLKALKKLLEPLEENEPESWVAEFPTIASSVANELHRMIGRVAAYTVQAENFLMYARSKQRKEAAERYCELQDITGYKSTLREIITIYEKHGDIHIFGTQLHVKSNATVATVKNIFDKFRCIQEEMRTAQEALSQVMKNLMELNASWGVSYGVRIKSEVFGEFDELVESGDVIAIERQLEVCRSYIKVLGQYVVCARNRKFRNPGLLDTMIQRGTLVADEDAWIKEALLFEAGYTKKEVS